MPFMYIIVTLKIKIKVHDNKQNKESNNSSTENYQQFAVQLQRLCYWATIKIAGGGIFVQIFLFQLITLFFLGWL